MKNETSEKEKRNSGSHLTTNYDDVYQKEYFSRDYDGMRTVF
jgi:hypothetical protein